MIGCDVMSIEHDRAVKDYKNEVEWSLNLIFIKNNVKCLVCGQDLEHYIEKHEDILKCQNGHETILRTKHMNT